MWISFCFWWVNPKNYYIFRCGMKLGKINWLESVGVADMTYRSTGYCYEVVVYKASHELWPISDMLCVPIWVIIIRDSSNSAHWLQQRHLLAKQSWHVLEFSWDSISVILRKVFLTCCIDLRHGADGFTFPLKEGVQWIFIALENPSPWPGLSLRTLSLVASMLLHHWGNYT
jgi:hypothetical protein